MQLSTLDSAEITLNTCLFVCLHPSSPIRLGISGEKKLCLTSSSFWSRTKYIVDAQYKKVIHSRLSGNNTEHLGILMSPQFVMRSILVSASHFLFLLFVSESDQLLCALYSSRAGVWSAPNFCFYIWQSLSENWGFSSMHTFCFVSWREII